jgi:DedD protein
MPPNLIQSPDHSPQPTKSLIGRRLIIAAGLIGLAIGGLALVDKVRDHSDGLAPPHEPAQALITTPAAEPDTAATTFDLPAIPPPPKVANNGMLTPPPRESGVPYSAQQSAANTSRPDPLAVVAGKAYLVQVGTFNSPANAQALQKQLQRAGIHARLETRVQLGPFTHRRDAEKALVRAKKLGIDGVLVSAR